MAKSFTIAKIMEGSARRTGDEGTYHFSLIILRSLWEAQKGSELQFEQFLPIRLTSLIEVTVRHYLRELTNSGGHFLVGGLELLGQRNIKDVTHALRAIQEKQLTVGDLVSNTQTTNSVEEIIAALERVYGKAFKEDLAAFQDRTEVELDGKPGRPIIADLDKTLAVIARMLQVRHIIVHEAPFHPPYEPHEIEQFFDATTDLLSALWWTIETKLHGKFPLKQGDINNEAQKDFEEAEEELDRVLKIALTKGSAEQLKELQAKWEDFAEHQASLHAGYLSGELLGSAAPMDYYGEKARLTRLRIKELKGIYGEKFATDISTSNPKNPTGDGKTTIN